MQEYKDGSYGEIKSLGSLYDDLMKNQDELDRTKAIHLGSKEELEALKSERFEVSGVVKYYGETLVRIEEKLDRIIKHFNIVKIIGE